MDDQKKNEEVRRKRFAGLFTTRHSVTLMEHPVRGEVGPKTYIGQLIVSSADGSLNAILDLAVNGFLCMLATVIKSKRLVELHIKLVEFSSDEWLLNYVRVKRIELDEVFGVFADRHFLESNAGRLETVSPAYGDYFRSVRNKLKDHGICDLIPGSLRQGPYLNTSPANVHHISRFSSSMKFDIGIRE